MPTWADTAWLRSLTTLPLILKSILDPEDAERAIGTGVDAIAVSNQPSRQSSASPDYRGRAASASWKRTFSSRPLSMVSRPDASTKAGV
ncbi:alpha-hydroxy-acid oxidizing protein, partial [Mesorhizobium sp. M7A.F.Ca.US.003.02.1.1]